MNKIRVALTVLGCRVNQSEGESLLATFPQGKYEQVPFHSEADIYIIHTCTVTSKADSKSRQLIRKAKRQNNESIVVVTGCYAQTTPGDLLGMEEVDLVLGVKDRNRVVEIVESFEKGNKRSLVSNVFKEKTFQGLPFTSKDKTRAFIKIEEGCESFCSYCIIPMARGPIRSNPIENIMEEITTLVAQGFKEVVLTGIHTGAYGKDFDNGTCLATLVKSVLSINGLERIRFGSLDPNEINDDFLQVFQHPKVMPHLHLALQSGDDYILEKMQRPYDKSLYSQVVEVIRSIKKDVSLTTDVMVGFPFETEEHHRNSMDFIELMRLDNLHIFKYSIRKGTKAAHFAQQVDETIKNRRSMEMQTLKEKLHSDFLKQMVGHNTTVLIEETKDGMAWGYSENYLKVMIMDSTLEENSIYPVIIKEVENDYLIAERKII